MQHRYFAKLTYNIETPIQRPMTEQLKMAPGAARDPWWRNPAKCQELFGLETCQLKGEGGEWTVSRGGGALCMASTGEIGVGDPCSQKKQKQPLIADYANWL